jgi:hypothetical protein
MELMTVVSMIVVLVLVYALWVWWKDGNTWELWCGRVGHRVRTALGVVSRDEMRVMHEHLQDREQRWEARLAKVEMAAKFSHQLQYVTKEIDGRLTKLEQSEDPSQSTENSGPIGRPRSLVRLGVRVTLSDELWANLGTKHVDKIEDHLIETMVQGPFCPVCLKRAAGRDRHKKLAEVPAQCRYCGVSWDSPETVKYPISVIDLKRQVYEHLDQEYRAGKMMF